MSKNHSGRAHSKFSASGAEKWFNCSASVEISEGLPDKSSPWAEEGTKAHEVLEALMQRSLNVGANVASESRGMFDRTVTKEMISLGTDAANFILLLGDRLNAEVLVENRVYLEFIHPEMFGTYDGAVLDHFGTLHVFDYKYGAGHAVSPRENLQMIFYGIGLAHKFNWNFKRVRLWIIQPRIKGYNGPMFWEVTIEQLKAYVPKFEEAVWRVENEPVFAEGSWCHWCKAKGICPLKQDAKLQKAKLLFSPIGRVNNGKEKSEKESSQKGREKAREKENESWEEAVEESFAGFPEEGDFF
jgi:hypothetical protein